MIALFGVCLVLLLAGRASASPSDGPADRTEPLPKRLEGIGVDEHLGGTLPLGLNYRNSDGQPVKLGDYFSGERPVIITLNYSNCPMLCSLQLSGFVTALKALAWTPGDEFDIVTVSLDPDEAPENAAKTKKRYLSQLNRAGAAQGWHFLTGDEASIRSLAKALGIRYGYNEKRKEYVHPALVSIATPDGRVARYLYGIEYLPKTLRLSLAEASEGTVGTTIDKLILYCFHYDETEGRYAPVARKLMSLGGALAVLVFGSFLGALWLSEFRKRNRITAESTT